jgi:hypothetical protein
VPMNDDPAPEHTLPHLLSNDTVNSMQFRLLRILKTGLLSLTALAVGGATLLLADPKVRITAITASHVDLPASSPDQAGAPPAQSIVEAQTASSAETEVPSDQPPTAAAPELIEPKPAEPKPADAAADRDALFRQFQAWAQQQNSKPDQQPNSGPEAPAQTTRDRSEQSTLARPPAETTPSAPAQTEAESPLQGSHAPTRTAQKRRVVREPANTRAEADPAQRAHALVLHPRSGPARPQPVQETRAQETPVQSPPAPSLMQQLFGVHN